MRKRLILLMAAALVVLGAVPVSAAPGGVPGPPEDKVKEKVAKDDAADDDVVDDEVAEEESKLPEWAKAYGKRIQDEYGMTYGHIQQCDGVGDNGDEDGESYGEASEDREALDWCTDEALADLEFPEDDNGAKAFWLFVFTGDNDETVVMAT